MARAPRDGCGPLVPQPAPRVSLPGFYRLGSSSGSTGDLTARGRRSVHGGCATDGRRGTDLLAGRRRARTATAGTRGRNGTTRNDRRADGGLRTGRAPGAGEATSAHAPALPPSVNGRRRGGTASTRPASTVLHPRAESAGTRLTARPAARMRPRPGGPVRRLPGNLPPALVFGPGSRRALACAGTVTVHARKGTSGMTSLVSQRSTRRLPRTITRQIPRTPRPADPGRAVGAGQRLNIPAGGDRD
jgi:hypothetical protein